MIYLTSSDIYALINYTGFATWVNILLRFITFCKQPTENGGSSFYSVNSFSVSLILMLFTNKTFCGNLMKGWKSKMSCWNISVKPPRYKN